MFFDEIDIGNFVYTMKDLQEARNEKIRPVGNWVVTEKNIFTNIITIKHVFTHEIKKIFERSCIKDSRKSTTRNKIC